MPTIEELEESKRLIIEQIREEKRAQSQARREREQQQKAAAAAREPSRAYAEIAQENKELRLLFGLFAKADGKTIKEIANMLAVSESRASQIVRHAIARFGEQKD